VRVVIAARAFRKQRNVGSFGRDVNAFFPSLPIWIVNRAEPWLPQGRRTSLEERLLLRHRLSNKLPGRPGSFTGSRGAPPNPISRSGSRTGSSHYSSSWLSDSSPSLSSSSSLSTLTLLLLPLLLPLPPRLPPKASRFHSLLSFYVSSSPRVTDLQ